MKAGPVSAPRIVLMDVARLEPNPHNARQHTPKQIRQIADNIREFGFTQPILINSERGVVAGHGRLEAAKQIGLTKVPTLCLSHLSKVQLRAYGIAERGWSQEQFAFEAGVHRTYVSEIERGVRNPTATMIEKLSKPLAIAPGRLLD